jgi:predicted DNA-binding transcriptional regulator AlpA
MARTVTSAEVTEMTMLSWSKLRELVNDERFPQPVGKQKARTKSGQHTFIWDYSEVNDWIRENRGYFYTEKTVEVTVAFTKQEWQSIQSAAENLWCDTELFIREAARFKADRVLDVVPDMSTRIRPSYLEVS